MPSMPDQSSSSPTRRRAGPPAGVLRPQGSATGEVGGLAEVDERLEAELVRGVLLLGRDRVTRARVLGLDQDQAGFDTGDVHRGDAHRIDAVSTDRRRTAGPTPAEPARPASTARSPGRRCIRCGSRRPARPRPRSRVDRSTAGRSSSSPVASCSTSRERRALQRERRRSVADIVDLDVEAGRVQQEPSVAGVGGGDAVASSRRDERSCRRRAPCLPRRTTGSTRRDRRGASSCRGSSPGRAGAGRRGRAPRTCRAG